MACSSTDTHGVTALKPATTEGRRGLIKMSSLERGRLRPLDPPPGRVGGLVSLPTSVAMRWSRTSSQCSQGITPK